MKRKYTVFLLLLLFAFASCSFTSKISDPNKDKLLVKVITYVLNEGHYSPKQMDDAFSEEVFYDYLEQLDPLKRYFYQSDIKEFEKFKTQLDDQLKQYDVSFFNLTYNRLMKRLDESKAIYQDILEKPFDFTIDEVYNSDYENTAYVKNKKQLKERWRMQLKFTTLANYDALLSETKEDDSETTTKTPKQLEAQARDETLKSINTYYNDYIEDLDREDWFSFYVNAIVEEFDPHTFYFAPTDKERFDQQMSGKLEGIGARLQKRMNNTKIVELISGGPAWRGKELEVGDIILKVRQENEKEAVNIVGMRLDDAIKLIKGPKGTKVILTVKKVDGIIKDINITRDLVELEETYAKSSIVKKNDLNFGVINLPKFYVDFKSYENRNAATDVQQEIERLKKQNIEGLVLDLRNNGGGSLQTVVDIAGLFIEQGPIVQVKSSGQPKQVLKDKDRSILWDGPLVILVNELSASASEILAAAMQDYKRAIIIGSKQTYGKGTVQNVVDLNNLVRNNSNGDLGALKITTQKFYRINGGSTQLEGVKSDVIVPDRYSFVDVGEKDQENPLPWDKIQPASYNIWKGNINYSQAITQSQARMQKNAQLQLIAENAKWVKQKMDENRYSLNYNKYKENLEQTEQEAKKYDKIADYNSNLTFSSLPYELKLFESDTVLQEKRNRWHESLSKDVYIEEALHVLEDLKNNNTIKNVATIKD